ncbi:SURF1 family protein [Undibacterium sp. CY18W]|uniref:SURF1-like protein n=1 Tax=Undibacterium hunanense TaxID=2762292 RepID=A0ABR6ZRK8_9BURK|nr:SURF1 family protein [Undibacterium hunanense]MBC3918514.1 SURF1 family protein [Undibacterium hunanense]
MPISFRFRPIPFIACLLLVSLGIALAQWQTRRAQEKELIATQMADRQHLPALALTATTPASEIQAFRKLQLRGQFMNEWPVYLDNRPLQGKAGLYVLMPFRLTGSNRYVLVARGWQQRDARDRTHVSADPAPTGELVLEGIVRDQLDRVMQLGAPETVKPGSIVQNLELDGIVKQTGWNFYPFIVEQTSSAGDKLSRDWPLPSAGADKHRGYAFQWCALALMAFVFFVVTGFRRGKNG